LDMMKQTSTAAFFILLLLGVISEGLSQDRSRIDEQMNERVGHGLRPVNGSKETGTFSIPPGISLEKALSEQDAVAVALWNNTGLEATLAELGLARADLIEAGQLVNPDLQMLFGIDPKPFELLLNVPIQALWQRPKRVAAAKLDLERVSESLVQNGIDLVRDVRIAHAELTLAEKQAEILFEAARLREKIADLTDLRLKHGDIDALQSRLARMEALTSKDTAARAQHQVGITQERLRILLSLPQGEYPDFRTEPSQLLLEPPPGEEELITAAILSRPDLGAAEMAVEAAGKRAGWERSRIFAYIAPQLSTKGVGTSGIKSGPGVKAEIPLFNRNQGKISRAEAEMEQAALRYLALVDQMEFEVCNARRQLIQAQETLDRIRKNLLPTIEETVSLAEKAYANGDISYLDFQLATVPVFDVRLSETNAEAALRQALAELERAVGRRL
jgi:cobalt-zinc-cadmium efflux system outer membrane protein